MNIFPSDGNKHASNPSGGKNSHEVTVYHQFPKIQLEVLMIMEKTTKQ